MPSSELVRPPAPLLVFDIETVPDGPLLWEKAVASGKISSEQPAPSTWGDLTATAECQKALEMDFPPVLYQSVVSICALFVHPESYGIVDGAKFTVPSGLNYAEFLQAEKKVLEDFWLFAKKHSQVLQQWYDHLDSDYRLSDYQRKKLKPIPVTFCGYNISGFDLPVLEQRSFRHLITCPIEDYAKESGYDSYRSRYGFDKTFDLYQFLCATGSSSARVGLDALARAIGLGGKMKGMDGSKVAEAYHQDHASQKIEDYCATDVLITYGVLLGLQKFRGVLSESSFAEAVAEFQSFLLKEGRPSTYRELERCSEEFFRHGKAALR